MSEITIVIFLSQENTPMFAEDSYQLQEGSPCIDTGDDNYAAISSHDLAARPRVIGSHIDRGAYEFDADATNIYEMKNEELRMKNDCSVYNLSGQMVNGKLSKVINIVKQGSASANGKKVIRK